MKSGLENLHISQKREIPDWQLAVQNSSLGYFGLATGKLAHQLWSTNGLVCSNVGLVNKLSFVVQPVVPCLLAGCNFPRHSFIRLQRTAKIRREIEDLCSSPQAKKKSAKINVQSLFTMPTSDSSNRIRRICLPFFAIMSTGVASQTEPLAQIREYFRQLTLRWLSLVFNGGLTDDGIRP
ncbi:hypothetical protein CDAR_122621 [Caerostris darwini]|uniref:Uncharacterized protein n=1 Tax=Caerostris darwini TaxID=1538125 RepID=A0AAV4M9E5_9ARAC|nr:hypothetical protein CDAR_122621 [Caerostris darwini]